MPHKSVKSASPKDRHLLITLIMNGQPASDARPCHVCNQTTKVGGGLECGHLICGPEVAEYGCYKKCIRCEMHLCNRCAWDKGCCCDDTDDCPDVSWDCGLPGALCPTATKRTPNSRRFAKFFLFFLSSSTIKQMDRLERSHAR